MAKKPNGARKNLDALCNQINQARTALDKLLAELPEPNWKSKDWTGAMSLAYQERRNQRLVEDYKERFKHWEHDYGNPLKYVIDPDVLLADPDYEMDKALEGCWWDQRRGSRSWDLLRRRSRAA